MSRTIRVADLFCGAGGTSTGAIQALDELGLRSELTAVNHWPLAVTTHSLNHPKGGDPAEWPEDVRVREYPEGPR